jgi:hypothetical protein
MNLCNDSFMSHWNLSRNHIYLKWPLKVFLSASCLPFLDVLVLSLQASCCQGVCCVGCHPALTCSILLWLGEQAAELLRTVANVRAQRPE